MKIAKKNVTMPPVSVIRSSDTPSGRNTQFMNSPALSRCLYTGLALVCLSGCGHKPTNYGIDDGGSSWITRVDDALPGIDAASVSVVTLKAGPPEGFRFVVWSDLPNGQDTAGGGRAGRASYAGQHRATDGRRIEFRAETTDGTTGSITIGDAVYDSTRGSLFLVSTQNDSCKVAQLDMDLHNFPKHQDQLIALAQSTEAIHRFFEEHNHKASHDQ